MELEPFLFNGALDALLCNVNAHHFIYITWLICWIFKIGMHFRA